MSIQLHIIGGGAVTPVGLSALQTCAAIRAGISGFNEILRTNALGVPQLVARIPADWRLRRTAIEWLVNMASKAIAEIVEDHDIDPSKAMLLLAAPERFRDQLFANEMYTAPLITMIADKLQLNFHSLSQLNDGGAASLINGLELAQSNLKSGNVDYVILGGVDSYVLDEEYDRLDMGGRLKGDKTAQGIVPGESAAFVLLANEQSADATICASIKGWGAATEHYSACGESYSQGKGMVETLLSTVKHACCNESDIDCIISNANGERYSAWEAMIARPRFYRTRRDTLPIIYPAMSVGETGAASAALALLVAGHGLKRGYSQGQTVMIEIASEGEGRAACLLTKT